MQKMLNSNILKFLFFSAVMLSAYKCGQPQQPKVTITEADKFVSSLDNTKLVPGTEVGEVITYLMDQGLSGSFKMKRGDGNTRLNIYTFSDNSAIVVVSIPRISERGLMFDQLKIEK